ncbi:PIN domain-containing protein [Phenylobacterium sp.]|uniref:PIN domain-containing protein n=1 Tax=Phenylobacterium sp. TaxID=1871053 RepID=UPI0025EFEA66|nr:PIN domain-containing protein [Phenylobacterium sp.]
MILSLDSNVLVDLLRRARPHVRKHMQQALASGATLKVSTVVAHELVLGAHSSARTQHQLELIGSMLTQMDVEPWSWEDALATGRLRAEMEGGGRGVGAYDTLIAGQALARGWTVVTADVLDFSRFAGLRILDWSDPAGPIDVTATMARLRRPSED